MFIFETHMQMMRVWELNIPSGETSLGRKKTRLDLKLCNDAAAIIISDRYGL